VFLYFLFIVFFTYSFFPVHVDDDVVAQWLVSGTVGDGEKYMGSLLCELHFWGKKANRLAFLALTFTGSKQQK